MSRLADCIEKGLSEVKVELEQVRADTEVDAEERFFGRPKSHQRRMHGRRHAGARIVQEGPTLLPTLDAHASRSEPFAVEDLAPYRNAEPPR